MVAGRHLIDGQWVQGGGPAMVWSDPATGEVTWQGHAATAAEIDTAVAAARGALGEWAAAPLLRRIGLMGRFAQVLDSQREELAETISRDVGKPRWEARQEVASMIAKVALSIEAYNERCRPAQREIAGAAAATRFKPHGVVAVLGPFNFPGHLPNGHIVPALLAGNTVVYKPSEQAPAVGQRVAELWERVELPPGVFNMVQGGRETGAALAGHRDLDGLFFTGSADAGRAINRLFADRPGKILALEMGGNNPLIVWSAADLNAAAYLTIQSAFLTSGQRCSCGRRLILPRGGEGNALLDRLLAVMRTVRVGRHTDSPEPFMGPVISDAAAEHLLAAQADLVARGGRALLEMRPIDSRWAMLSPGLIDATEIHDRPDAELFGPILQVIRVGDFDAALAEANNTAFGLTAGVFTDDPALWERFYRATRAGVVYWNRPITGASSQLPFGGTGDSGNNRPSGYWAADYCSYPVASLEKPALVMPTERAGDWAMSEAAFEVNFDGLVGPTHNYAGLPYGNVAAQRHRHRASNPRAAALQGLQKMKLLADMGVMQGVLPPQERPAMATLRAMGFAGSDAKVLRAAQREAPALLAACCSASSMWAANAATGSPSADTADGRIHFTPANMVSHLHRSIEAPTTVAVFRAIFPGEAFFAHHPPLPGALQLRDEGAANHLRLCPAHGRPGVEVFVYGREATGAGRKQPARYPARQTLEASGAVARRHQLDPAATVFVQQNPAAIDAGAFHNDVVAVANQNVLLYHSAAFADSRRVLEKLRRVYLQTCGDDLMCVEVSEKQAPLADAIRSYLLNSQLLTLPDGSMCLLCPVECRRTRSTREFLARLLDLGTPIRAVRFVDVRQSMRNGGGPACLRLRVVLTERQLRAVHQGVLFTNDLYGKLVTWVKRHYRDRLTSADLADPQLLRESRAALDELTGILRLSGLYGFQRE